MATLDHVRVGFIGAGRISDLHALEYGTNPDASIVAIADVNADLAAERARRWGFPAGAHLLRLPRAARRSRCRCGRDPVAAPPPCRSGAGRHGCRQARLAAEADDHSGRRCRPADRARQDDRRRLPRLREFRLLPADREGEGAGRCRRHRRPQDHPHQEQSRPQRDRLGGAGRSRCLAAGPDAERRRAAGLRRRAPQVRHRLALHGAGRGGPCLDRHDRARERHVLRRAGDHLVEVSRQPLRQSRDRLFARTRHRDRALCPGRPGRDHRHGRRHHHQSRPRPHQRPAAGDALRRRTRARASPSPMPISAGRRASSIPRATSSPHCAPAPSRG